MSGLPWEYLIKKCEVNFGYNQIVGLCYILQIKLAQFGKITLLCHIFHDENWYHKYLLWYTSQDVSWPRIIQVECRMDTECSIFNISKWTFLFHNSFTCWILTHSANGICALCYLSYALRWFRAGIPCLANRNLRKIQQKGCQPRSSNHSVDRCNTCNNAHKRQWDQTNWVQWLDSRRTPTKCPKMSCCRQCRYCPIHWRNGRSRERRRWQGSSWDICEMSGKLGLRLPIQNLKEKDRRKKKKKKRLLCMRNEANILSDGMTNGKLLSKLRYYFFFFITLAFIGI